jgi:FAD/FMN-containing dehydrogenase
MNIIDKVAEIVGQENFSTRTDDTKCYSTDSSQLEGTVQAVVWPKNSDDLQTLVRFASIKNLQLVPRGAGTSLEGGTIPKDAVIVDMSRMNRIISLHRDDKCVTIEPGVTLKRLNAVLKNFALFFPITPTSGKVCTIGGMVANNSHGNYTHKYGRVGDWVLELGVIDGTGKSFTIKDMTKVIGSEGTLVFIVSITLRLLQSFNDIFNNVFVFKNAHDTVEKVKELQSDDSVLSIQYFDKTCSHFIRNDEEEETHTLLVEYSEPRGQVGSLQDIKDKIFRELHKAKFHHIRQVMIPQAKIEDFLKFTRRSKVTTFGNISKGIFQMFFTEFQKKEVGEVLAYIVSIQGQPLNFGIIHKEHMPEAKKTEFITLKQKYDPQKIMNSDKVQDVAYEDPANKLLKPNQLKMYGMR